MENSSPLVRKRAPRSSSAFLMRSAMTARMMSPPVLVTSALMLLKWSMLMITSVRGWGVVCALLLPKMVLSAFSSLFSVSTKDLRFGSPV